METRRVRAGTSDLVGQMVGALVSTALVFEDTDAAYYDRLMTQALSLYGAGMRRRGKYSDVFLYDCAPRVRLGCLGFFVLGFTLAAASR